MPNGNLKRRLKAAKTRHDAAAEAEYANTLCRVALIAIVEGQSKTVRIPLGHANDLYQRKKLKIEVTEDGYIELSVHSPVIMAESELVQ